MIKRIFIILLFLVDFSAYSQELYDMTYKETEVEDSISAMSFVRIRKPKALLDSIIVQVIRDSQQKPLACKYQVEERGTDLHPSTSRCEFYAKANIRIKAIGKPGEFHYEGTPLLRNYYDTARVCHAMREFCLEGDYMLGLVQKDCMNDETVLQSFEHLMSLHHIKVYRISDGSGRGIYRVDFFPRKHIGYGRAGSKFTGTAYFDRRLRLMQIKADKISPTSFKMGRQVDKPLSLTHLERYQMDFEETDGRNVVKLIEDTIYVDGQLSTTYMVKLLP